MYSYRQHAKSSTGIAAAQCSVLAYCLERFLAAQLQSCPSCADLCCHILSSFSIWFGWRSLAWVGISQFRICFVGPYDAALLPCCCCPAWQAQLACCCPKGGHHLMQAGPHL